ncbi:MAG: NYN domain-containing protein [Elusimicrobia bacterium]|nr:NYN domain-containing protein [Candidatus Obscuribacterium magneticum]
MLIQKRVITYIDGFNLYHAINDLGKNHLKWLDLWGLSSRFATKPDQFLTAVKYFSAFATWLPGPYKRHRDYVDALKTNNVEFIEGGFKEKTRYCKNCHAKWIGHEEKETDVNIAIHILNDAYLDLFDQALLFSADSDLVPVIKLVKQLFPQKFIYIVKPPKVWVPKELIRAAGGFQFFREIKESHLEKCLFPEHVVDSAGKLVSERPEEYKP